MSELRDVRQARRAVDSIVEDALTELAGALEELRISIEVALLAGCDPRDVLPAAGVPWPPKSPAEPVEPA